MAANQLESRIPPTTPGWSWQCGPALNPPKDIFLSGYVLGTQGPHAVSKALGKHCHWHDHWRKPASDGLNLKNLPLIPSALLHLPLCNSIRPWKPCFLLLRPSKIFIFFCSSQSSQWWFGSKPSPRQQEVRPSPPVHLCHCSDRCPLVFVNLSAHSPPMAAAAGHKNKSKIERPTLYIN